MSIEASSMPAREISFCVPSGVSKAIHAALKRSNISFHYADDVPSCTCQIYFTPPSTSSRPVLGYFPKMGSKWDRIGVEVVSDLHTTSFNLLPAVATALEELGRLTKEWKDVNYSERSLDRFKSLVKASEIRLRDDPFTAQFVSQEGLIWNPSTDTCPDSCKGCVELQAECISDVLVNQIYRSKHLDEYHCDPQGWGDREMPGEGVVEPTEAQFREAGTKVSEILKLDL